MRSPTRSWAVLPAARAPACAACHGPSSLYPGFIVRSEMFNAFMEQTGLWDYVFEMLDTIDFSSNASLVEVSAEIRQRIEDTLMPTA